jgi:hypothetical protein
MRTCASLCGPTTISQHPSSPNPHSPTPQRFSIVSNADQALLRPDAIRPSSEPHRTSEAFNHRCWRPQAERSQSKGRPDAAFGRRCCAASSLGTSFAQPIRGRPAKAPRIEPSHSAPPNDIQPLYHQLSKVGRRFPVIPLSSPSPFFSDANKGPRCAPERTRNTSSAGRPTL